MSDKSNEQISNLMDGELEINASNFLLKRMAADKSLASTWENYHLIKSCLQKQADEPLVIDVATHVCQQLKQQGNINISQNLEANVKQPILHKLFKPVLGLGIAASVAFMSVFMIQNKNDENIIPFGQDTIAQATISQATISQETGLKPLPINISANMVSGNRAIVNPPASLSRFPSVSAKNSYNYSQGFSQNNIAPYLIILNQGNTQKHLTPLRINNISD